MGSKVKYLLLFAFASVLMAQPPLPPNPVVPGAPPIGIVCAPPEPAYFDATTGKLITCQQSGIGGEWVWTTGGFTAPVTSVSGTAGQIIPATPQTGAVVLGLPLTITQPETFSGGVTVTGPFVASASTRTAPAVVVATVGALPGGCTVGDQGIVTGATATQQLYVCTATGVWTEQGGGGGGGGNPGGAYGTIQFNNTGAFGGSMPLNVLGIGVRSDGVTDDTAAWNAAVASIEGAGGGTLLFPNTGACSVITKPISIGNGLSAINIVIEGQSPTTQENVPSFAGAICPSNPAQDAIDINMSSDADVLAIRNLTIKYPGTPPSGTASVNTNVLTGLTGNSMNPSWYQAGGNASVYIQNCSVWAGTPCPASDITTITGVTAGSAYISPSESSDNGFVGAGITGAINQSSYGVLNWQLSAITPVTTGVLALTGTTTWSLVKVTPASTGAYPGSCLVVTGTGSPVTCSVSVSSTAGHTLVLVGTTANIATTTPSAFSSATANAGDTVTACPLNLLSGSTVYSSVHGNTGNVMCAYVLNTAGGTNVSFNLAVTSVSGKLLAVDFWVLEYAAGTVTYDNSNALSNTTCPVACPAPTLSVTGGNDLYMQMMATGQGNNAGYGPPLGFGPPGSMTIAASCSSGCPTSGNPTTWTVGVAEHAVGANYLVGFSETGVTLANAGVGFANDKDAVTPSHEHMSFYNDYIGYQDGGSQASLISASVFQGGFVGWDVGPGTLVESPAFHRVTIESQSGPQFRTSSVVYNAGFVDIWHEFPGSDMYQVLSVAGGVVGACFQHSTWTNAHLDASTLGSGNVFNIVVAAPSTTGMHCTDLTLHGGALFNLPSPNNFTAINGSSSGVNDPQTSGSAGYENLGLFGMDIVSAKIGGLLTAVEAPGGINYIASPNFSCSTQIPANHYSGLVPPSMSLGTNGVLINCLTVPLNLPPGTPTYTAGTGVTSVACSGSYAPAGCTNTRGTIEIQASTATTGTIATINFTGLTTAPASCTVTENTGTHEIGSGVQTSSSVAITAGLTVASSILYVTWFCQP